MYRVVCECGIEIEVLSAKAGSTVTCECGRILRVPRLSVLRASAAQNAAAPAIVDGESSVEHLHTSEALPDSFCSVCAGDVGSHGSVSVSALDNYMGCIALCMEKILKEVQETQGFEIVLGCALLPDKVLLVEINSFPTDRELVWKENLEQAIREVPLPPTCAGPVAFVCYRRVMLEASILKDFKPFPELREAFHTDDLEVALARAGGLEPERSTDPKRPSVWNRVVESLIPARLRKKPEPTPEQVYAYQKNWFEETEAWSRRVGLDDLERSLTENPDSLGFRLTLARKYYELERWEDAIKIYTQAIRVVENCAPLIYRRAHAHLQAGDREAALRDFNQAIELVPLDPWFYHSRASVYIAIEAWKAAKEDLDRAIGLAPNDPAFYLARAQTCHRFEEAADMEADLNRSLELDPNFGPSHVMMGSLLQAYSPPQTARAIEHFTRAIALMPGDLPSRIARSLAYLSENKYALALDDCDRLLELDPQLPAAHGIRGRVLQLEGEYEAAIEACTQAIELGSEDSMVYVARGFSHSATGDPIQADEDYKAALRLDPENPLVLQLRGKLNLDTGDLEAAMEDFRKASEIAPDWSEPRAHIAFVHRMNDNPQAAVDEQSALIAREPNHAGHFVNRAFAYMQLSEFDLAESDYNRALEIAPDDEQIYFYRGKFWLERQRLENALSDFDKVLALGEEDSDSTRYYRAHVYVQMKRYEEAVDEFEKLTASYPEDPRAFLSRAFPLGVIGDEKRAHEDREQLNELSTELSELYASHYSSGCIERLVLAERFEEALAETQRLIDTTPDDPMSFSRLASVYWHMEAYVEACENLAQALELVDPESDSSQMQLLNSRGQILAEMGECESALLDLNRVIDQSRKDGKTLQLAYALNGRSLALSGLDRHDESERDFNESVSLCPTNPWVFYNRGLQLYQRGKREDAGRLLRQALELSHPRLPARKKQRAKLALKQLEEFRDA